MKGTQKLEGVATRDLEKTYRKSLELYLAGGSEADLQTAYEIGRSAIAEGLGVLDMGAIHHAALRKVFEGGRTSASLDRDLDRAKEFFDESLSPYEMAHRGFLDAISALRRLNETLENEIKRIAHAVHDEAGQLVVAARLAVSEVAHDLSPSLQARLQDVGTILDQVEKQLRRLSHELRPTILDDLGLVPALQFLADGVSKRTKLTIRVESSLEGRHAAADVETALYRVVQEALTNVTKHSSAKNVDIQLTRDTGTLHCKVRDDGVGFNVPEVFSRKGQKGLGLVGIRERLSAVGGMVEINSAPGQGTELRIKIPMEKENANSSGSCR
jgi:signal transduction histidine kinase